jgi:hypothetical protein
MSLAPQRPILLGAVRRLVEAARSARSHMAAVSHERQFYLGVEAAAGKVLHPEVGVSRAPDWLDRETPEFREGFLRTSTMLAAARTAAEPPMRLPLPDPRPRGGSPRAT